MASEKTSSSSGSIGARLLIVIYSAGLVMLGLYPIQREYGSFWSFVDKEILSGVSDASYESVFRDLPGHKTAEKRQKVSEEKASWLSRKLSELRNVSVSGTRERARMLWPEAKKVPVAKKNTARAANNTAKSKAENPDRENEADRSPDNLDVEDRNQLDSLFEKLP